MLRSRMLLLLLVRFTACAAYPSRVVVNEIMSENAQAGGGIVDRNGGSADWFELYNPEDRLVNVGRLWILDESGEAWRIPPLTMIGPRGHLLIFADDTRTAGTELHSPLDLGETGTLFVFGRDDELLDEAPWPPLRANHSWSRMPDGSDDWAEDDTPTPLAANE